jgi:hypothetical protein
MLMLKKLALALSGCLAVSLCVATLAAPAQQDRPGIVLQPRVIVENRGRSQVIPVSVQEWATGEKAITVQVVGRPTVDARLVLQAWSYRTVKVPVGQDLAAALTAAGDEGWEVTGVQVADSSGTSLLLKRPR